MFTPPRKFAARALPSPISFLLALLACLPALLLAAPAAPAQVGGTDITGTGGRHVIQGRLFTPSGNRADLRLKVRLESTGSGELSVYTDSNGTFKFGALRPGSYTVVVEGGDNYETHTESVFVEPVNITTRRRETISMPVSRPVTLQIYLRPKRAGAGEGRAEVVSAALASVPKPALERYQKAQALARAGEHERAIEELRAAVDAHPRFALALGEMGALYLKIERPDKAAEAFRAALRLDPDDYAALVGCGVALFDAGEFGEAEAQLRRALRENESSSLARLYLGRALIRRQELGEAERELLRAAAAKDALSPAAHYYLGGIYWARRDHRRAAEHLETYLRLAPDAPDAARVRETVKQLRDRK
ncbi:MAG TPA: tetratricopeptide repeat protein [Pyrinomonadaceae bacterium]|nr:tetratricopeptide repeat protein [Pyrinomonadaceae bacterium]